MTLSSCLYVGSVVHRRLRPRPHRFKYRLFWLFADLGELPFLARRLRGFSYNRPNLFSFYDKDHGDGSATPLRLQVRRHLAEAGIDLGKGRIFLLAMPRTLFYCFNPLSVYFCHDEEGRLCAVIYQVHNTFGERHAYVMPVDPTASSCEHMCKKTFFVSPFMTMDLTYDFRLAQPQERVSLAIRARGRDGAVLHAALIGRRVQLGDRALLRLALQIPAVTLKVIFAIHWQALRLFLKGIRYRGRGKDLAQDLGQPLVREARTQALPQRSVPPPLQQNSVS